MNEQELKHYGVLGMKWGKRKSQPVASSDLRRRYDSAKVNAKRANKAYSKAFDRYSANPLNAFTKKGNAKFEEAVRTAKIANKANDEYKAIKKERKQALKSTYKDVKRNTKIYEKLIYNDATRKKAAKYVVDNNMPIADAKKKANKEAIRNTAIILGAFGGYTMHQLRR